MRAVCKIAGLILIVWPAVAGDVTVQVQITRRLTKKSVAPTVYNLRGAAAGGQAPQPEPVNEFDRTVVMLAGKKPAPLDPQTITIEQRDSHFEPDLAVVPVGSTARFPNADPIFHNVFSLSRAQPFDLGFYPKSQSKSVKFDRPGIVQVYCHIHANMYAAIVVTDTPWYGRPGKGGDISFANVPEGHYKVSAWHKVAGLYRAEVDVPANGRAMVTIRVPLDSERQP
jgi:plastocyanin